MAKPKTTKLKRGTGGSRKQLIGLRQYTGRVADTLQEHTPMTHVALVDSMVSQINSQLAADAQRLNRDDANVQRRTYDALNILQALKFITKSSDKKYHWIGPLFSSADGLPVNQPLEFADPVPGIFAVADEVVDVPTPSAAVTPRVTRQRTAPPSISLAEAENLAESSDMQSLRSLYEGIATLRLEKEENKELVLAMHDLHESNSTTVCGPRLEPPFVVLAVPGSVSVDAAKLTANGSEWSVVIDGGFSLFSDRQIIRARIPLKKER